MILKRNARNQQSTSQGTYTLADSKINGYPHWIQESGDFALWFSKGSSAWEVGNYNYLGEDQGHIIGPYGNDEYPNRISSGWIYGDQTKYLSTGNPWKSAYFDEVIFKALT